MIADPHGRYYGIAVSEKALVPNDDARLGKIRFDGWLRTAKPMAKTGPRERKTAECLSVLICELF